MASHQLDANQCIQEAFDLEGGGLKISTTSSAGTPVIENIELPTANIEVAFPLPAETKQFQLKVRGYTSKLQLAFQSGMSSSNYITIERGCSFDQPNVFVLGGILYMQCNKPNQVVEILIWT